MVYAENLKADAVDREKLKEGMFFIEEGTTLGVGLIPKDEALEKEDEEIDLGDLHRAIVLSNKDQVLTIVVPGPRTTKNLIMAAASLCFDKGSVQVLDTLMDVLLENEEGQITPMIADVYMEIIGNGEVPEDD